MVDQLPHDAGDKSPSLGETMRNPSVVKLHPSIYIIIDEYHVISQVLVVWNTHSEWTFRMHIPNMYNVQHETM